MSGIVGGAGSKSGVIGTTELDYETGIYTVTTYMNSGTWTNGTYYQLAYTKIGRLVTVMGELRCTAVSSPSSSCSFSLPFVPATPATTPLALAHRPGFGVRTHQFNFGSGMTQLCGLIYMNGTAKVYLYGQANNANSLDAIPDAGNELVLNFSYVTDQ